MHQPELGKRLTALRKKLNITQEQLVEKSHVSVRTIQRIESGEIMPRISTVKILLEALGERYETFSTPPEEIMENQKSSLPNANRNTLLTAALAGGVYLVAEIILGTMEVSWMIGERNWEWIMNTIYAGLTGVMVISYLLFARGFIALSALFENTLLKAASYMLMIATFCMGVLNLTSLSVTDMETLWFPYSIAAVLFGALSIVFGVALIQLQDSMGELSRIAGLLEIGIGCLLITVVLFFIAYVIMIPAIVLEILVLYRGYEYLSKPEAVIA